MESPETFISREIETLNTGELELLVGSEMERNNISSENSAKILDLLSALKSHDIDTYSHSLRVGIRASQIGSELELRVKPLLIAGVLHDFGKTTIDGETLNKKADFDDSDYEKVKGHVIGGYEILEEEFPFSAAVFVRHHSFGDNPYPNELPALKSYLQHHEQEIEDLSALISILDFYDASKTRVDGKNGGEKLSSADIKSNLLEHFPGQEELITGLYNRKLLT